jgi:hypothetical protein
MVEPFIMVLTLLTIGAIPTVIGTSEAVNAKNKQELEEKKSAKFHLLAECCAKSRRRGEINNRAVVLRDHKVGTLYDSHFVHVSLTVSQAFRRRCRRR